MGLFSSKKIVVGLFDNDKALEDVMNELQARGMGDDDDNEITVFDQNYISGRMAAETESRVVAAPPNPSMGGGMAGPGVVGEPLTMDGGQPDTIAGGAKETLTDMGLDDETAEFYARRVGRGNAVVIIQTSEDRAPAVREVMERFGTRVLVS